MLLKRLLLNGSSSTLQNIPLDTISKCLKARTWHWISSNNRINFRL